MVLEDSFHSWLAPRQKCRKKGGVREKNTGHTPSDPPFLSRLHLQTQDFGGHFRSKSEAPNQPFWNKDNFFTDWGAERRGDGLGVIQNSERPRFLAGFVLLWKFNAAADLTGGKGQAVMWAMWNGSKHCWNSANLPTLILVFTLELVNDWVLGKN